MISLNCMIISGEMKQSSVMLSMKKPCQSRVDICTSGWMTLRRSCKSSRDHNSSNDLIRNTRVHAGIVNAVYLLPLQDESIMLRYHVPRFTMTKKRNAHAGDNKCLEFCADRVIGALNFTWQGKSGVAVEAGELWTKNRNTKPLEEQAVEVDAHDMPMERLN